MSAWKPQVLQNESAGPGAEVSWPCLHSSLFRERGRAQTVQRDNRVFWQQEETLSLLQHRHFLPCNKPNIKYYHITFSMSPAALQVPPNTSIFWHSSQRESSFLTKGEQEITMNWAHQLISMALLSFSLLWTTYHAFSLPSRAWHERQHDLWPAPGMPCVPCTHLWTTSSNWLSQDCRQKLFKLCKHRGYYTSSVLVTVSSSLITVVMIGLWPVNSFKETNHYRMGRLTLL